MPNPFRAEKIANWVADFCQGREIVSFTPGLRERAQPLLEGFLAAACSRRDIEPDEVLEEDVRQALAASASARLTAEDARGAPDMIAAFLGALESQGRLGGGRALGAFVRAHRRLLESSAGPVTAPVRREASKLGPNDPCPCGSGRKFKKCCRPMGRK